MCLSQIIQNPIANLVAGFALGVLASWIVAHLYWRKSESVSIIQNGKDLARDCHRCIDLLRTLLNELAQRKYSAYRLLQKLANVDEDVRHRTKNSEALRIEKAEMATATIENLITAITLRKLDDKTKRRHRRRLGPLIEKMGTLIAEAKALTVEIEKIDRFSMYFDQVEGLLGDKTYIEFMEKL